MSLAAVAALTAGGAASGITGAITRAPAPAPRLSAPAVQGADLATADRGIAQAGTAQRGSAQGSAQRGSAQRADRPNIVMVADGRLLDGPRADDALDARR